MRDILNALIGLAEERRNSLQEDVDEHTCDEDGEKHVADADEILRQASDAIDKLFSIARRVALLTDEGDDRMYGVYIDQSTAVNGVTQRIVRAKGSTLALARDARQVFEQDAE